MASNPKRPRIHGAAPPAASGTSGALAEGVEAYRKWRNAREKKQENTEARGEAQELEVLGDEEDMESMVVHVQQAQVGQVESRVPRPWIGRGSHNQQEKALQGRAAPVAPLHASPDQEGRTHQEWWMPPFLVPIAEVAAVQGETPGTTEKAVLLQFSDDPGSGGPKTQQQYTNIHRIECLARSHPLVWMVQRHKETKALDKSKYDKFGRAVKFHQSPHDLRLSLGSRVEMLVGCSVNGAGQGLLSLWWSAAPKCKHTPEQESLARAVFLDLAEAAHDVPSMYAADYRAASGASAAAPSTSQAPRTTTLPLARPGAADYYAARPRKRRCLASYYGR